MTWFREPPGRLRLGAQQAFGSESQEGGYAAQFQVMILEHAFRGPSEMRVPDLGRGAARSGSPTPRTARRCCRETPLSWPELPPPARTGSPGRCATAIRPRSTVQLVYPRPAGARRCGSPPAAPAWNLRSRSPTRRRVLPPAFPPAHPQSPVRCAPRRPPAGNRSKRTPSDGVQFAVCGEAWKYLSSVRSHIPATGAADPIEPFGETALLFKLSCQ